MKRKTKDPSRIRRDVSILSFWQGFVSLEFATRKELQMLAEGGYGLPEWGGKEGYVVVGEIESNPKDIQKGELVYHLDDLG